MIMQFRTDQSEEPIPEKEPVFVLRAMDPIAHDTIMYWATRAHLHHEIDDSIVEDARKFARLARRYQQVKNDKENKNV